MRYIFLHTAKMSLFRQSPVQSQHVSSYVYYTYEDTFNQCLNNFLKAIMLFQTISVDGGHFGPKTQEILTQLEIATMFESSSTHECACTHMQMD